MKSGVKLSLFLAIAALVAASCSRPSNGPSGTSAARRQVPPPTAAAETYAEFLKRVGGEKELYAPLETPVTVALLGVSKTHEYQLRRDKAAQATAEAMNVNLLLDDYRSEVGTQRTKAKTMLLQGAQALITTARDDASFSALAKYLNREKVYLVAEGGTNDQFRRDELPYYATYVGVDNYRKGVEGGEWTAKYFQKHFPGQTPRLAIAAYPNNKQTVQRAEGFIEGFKGVDPRLVVVFNDDVGGGGGRDQVLPKINNVFTAYQFNVFFAVWDESTMAGVMAARRHKLTRKDLMMVGYDGTFEVARLIAKGESPVVADIAQDPEVSGRATVAIAAHVAAGHWKPEDLPMFIWTAGSIITEENARSYLKDAGQEVDPP